MFKKEFWTYYLNTDNIEQSILNFNNRLNKAKYQLSIKRFFNRMDIGYNIVSRDWRKVAQNLEYTFRHINEKINSPEEVINHTWTNKIGEYYIHVI